MRPKLVEELANNGHVVTHCSAGGQTVVCCTATCVVAWGQGPHGELGLADKKSSAKPTFVTALDGKSVLDVSCGYGQTLFVVEDAKGLRHVDSKELVKVTPKNIK
jgi:alpha-tubulin suppressor-like RCC1 family protein